MILEISIKTTKQECIPVGCVPSAAVAITGGGVCHGVSAQGGASAQMDVHPRVYPSMQWGRHPLPLVDRILDTHL